MIQESHSGTTPHTPSQICKMDSSTATWRPSALHVVPELIAWTHAEKMKRRAVYRKHCTVYMQKNAYFLINFTKRSHRTNLVQNGEPASPCAPLWRTSCPLSQSLPSPPSPSTAQRRHKCSDPGQPLKTGKSLALIHLSGFLNLLLSANVKVRTNSFC